MRAAAEACTLARRHREAGHLTYYVSVVRAASSLGLTALRVLSSQSEELALVPVFNPTTYLYTAASNDTSLKAYVIVDAAPSSGAKASVAVHGTTVPASHVPLDMTSCAPVESTTELDIVATGATGKTETYRVLVHHPLPTPDVATLNATPGVLSPAFSPSMLNYTLTLPNSSVSEVALSAMPTVDCPDGVGSIDVVFTADGAPIAGSKQVTIPIDRDHELITMTVYYIWHRDDDHIVSIVLLFLLPTK